MSISDDKLEISSSHDKTEWPVVIEGIVRDSFFAADGTLLYLVLKAFAELKVGSSEAPYLDALLKVPPSTPSTDQLVVEGRNIALARYYRVPLPTATVAKIEATAREESEDISPD